MPNDACRLFFAWGLLMALTAALALLTDARHEAALPPVGVAATAAVVLIKCRIVLSHYLDLRRAPGALRGFLFAIAIILVIVAASFVAAALIA